MINEMKLSHFDYSLITEGNNIFILPLLYSSRYFGLLSRYNNFFIKTIDRIENMNLKNKKIEEIKLKDYNELEILYEDDSWENYKLLDGKLIYKTNREAYLKVYFDVRHLYDIDEWGRIYNYRKINDNLVEITFNKGEINYIIRIKDFVYLYENNEKWVKVYYNYDEYRKSP
ncbi:MAG: hypothetical protein ACPLX8_00300, partial [Nanopusillaceae archaeon]